MKPRPELDETKTKKWEGSQDHVGLKSKKSPCLHFNSTSVYDEAVIHDIEWLVH